MSKPELHSTLCEAFGVDRIHSEYGMAELTSQAYSSGEGIFFTPPWMRISIRDLNDPFTHLATGQRGGSTSSTSEYLLLRIHPDRGCRTPAPERRFRSERTYRPQRDPRLQPAGTKLKRPTDMDNPSNMATPVQQAPSTTGSEAVAPRFSVIIPLYNRRPRSNAPYGRFWHRPCSHSRS